MNGTAGSEIIVREKGPITDRNPTTMMTTTITVNGHIKSIVG